MKKVLLTIITFYSLSLMSCAVQYLSISSTDQHTDVIPEDLLEDAKSLTPSFDIPYEDRIIRTHFHFFNNADSTINYHPNDAPTVVQQLLESANNRMHKNDKMSLPPGNDTPVYDTHIRYALARHNGEPGIFYHFLDQPEYFIKKGKKANQYDRRVIKKYVEEPDSVLNVFIMPFDPVQLASGMQRAEKTAIALGTAIKLPGLFQSGLPTAEYAGIFNHEVGHILGLRHSWKGNDGCDDTPINDNCWNTTDAPPCNGPTSNNLMDYNAHQSAITPCQIARMQSNIANQIRMASRLVSPDDCYKTHKVHFITNHQKWAQPARLHGDLVIANGGILYLRSRIQMATDVEIRIEKGGILILENATLYNSCGHHWRGIKKHPHSNLYLIGRTNRITDVAVNGEDITND